MDVMIAVITRMTPLQHSSSLNAEARVKACLALSVLEIGYDNKIPMFSYPGALIVFPFLLYVVQQGDILPTLVGVTEEDAKTEANFKCVAVLTLLVKSLKNAILPLESAALDPPPMVILHNASPNPAQWKVQTASWCIGFLMNMAQSNEAVPALCKS
eukprot:3699036-Ditylum_brightwellii.AAC.1